MINLRKPLVPLLILAIGAGGYLLLYWTRPEKQPAIATEKTWRVDVVTAARSGNTVDVSLYGHVESPLDSRLSAALTADVAALPVREGDVVRSGQLLVELDDRDYQLALRQREAELAEVNLQIDNANLRHRFDKKALRDEQALASFSRSDVQRQRELVKRKLVSESRVEESKSAETRQSLSLKQRQLTLQEHDVTVARLAAQLERAEAQRDRAQLDLERTRIRAPFDGFVTATHVAPGERVRAGDLLVELYAVNGLEIRAQIPARHLQTIRSALASGQTLAATITVGKQRLSATLDRLSRHVNPGRAGQDAFFTIGDGTNLSLGQTVQLQLALPLAQPAFALPANSVHAQSRVYVAENNQMVEVEVDVLGQAHAPDGTRMLVESTRLQVGMQVVTTPLPNAREGLPIEVQTTGMDTP